MAHLEEDQRTCSVPACHYAPTFVLFNEHNLSVGRYCKRHALPELQRLQAWEERRRLQAWAKHAPGTEAAHDLGIAIDDAADG